MASADRPEEAYSSSLYNEDLAPATVRTWKTLDISAMWMSVVHNLGQYTIAAGLFVLGLSAIEVLIAYLVAFVILQIASNMMGYIGQRTGVPYPVVARVSFGVFGANFPALVRGIVAIFWYGIQTYLAAQACIAILISVWPSLAAYNEASTGMLGLPLLGWICFTVIWALQLFIVTHGMESIRRFQTFAGPIIWLVMLALTITLLAQAGGKISLTTSLVPDLSGGEHARLFFVGIFAIVASLATLALNVSDFTRFAPTKRTVRLANFWGLPVNGAAFGIVSVLCTASALALYGRAITDPAELIAQQDNKVIVIVGAFLFLAATMGVNIAANVVSPAYDLANAWPSKINFKRGAVITSVVAFVSLPWKIFATPVLVVYFLGAVGAFLGPLFGVMMWDWYRLRRGQFSLADMYRADPAGKYYYRKGFNPRAFAAAIPACIICATIALVPVFSAIAPFAWPIGVVLGAAFYAVATRGVNPEVNAEIPAHSTVEPTI